MVRFSKFKHCSLMSRITPAAWFFFFLITGWGLSRLFPIPIPFRSFIWKFVSALTVFSLSTLFAVCSIRLYKVHQTSLEPFSQPSVLLTTGPYRISRNPLYIALVAVLAAFGLLLASFWFPILALFLIIVLDRIIIPSEEAVLLKAFGDHYSAYTHHVRRWF